jgi:hypothetical protein
VEKYKIDFESMRWESPMAGVRFKAYEQGGKKLRLVEFGREFVEPDWCTKGHIGYVLEGQMEINFDGNVVAFGPGDGIFICNSHYFGGFWTKPVLLNYLISLPVILVAILLGGILNRRIPSGKFDSYVYICLFVLGIILLVKTGMSILSS